MVVRRPCNQNRPHPRNPNDQHCNHWDTQNEPGQRCSRSRSIQQDRRIAPFLLWTKLAVRGYWGGKVSRQQNQTWLKWEYQDNDACSKPWQSFYQSVQWGSLLRCRSLPQARCNSGWIDPQKSASCLASQLVSQYWNKALSQHPIWWKGKWIGD